MASDDEDELLRFSLATGLLFSRPIEDIPGDTMGEVVANVGLKYAIIFGEEADVHIRRPCTVSSALGELGEGYAVTSSTFSDSSSMSSVMSPRPDGSPEATALESVANTGSIEIEGDGGGLSLGSEPGDVVCSGLEPGWPTEGVASRSSPNLVVNISISDSLPSREE